MCQRQSTPTKPSIQTPRRCGLTTDTGRKISSSPGKADPDESGSTTDESKDDPPSSYSKPLPSRKEDALASSPMNDTKGMESELLDMDDDGLTASASDMDNTPTKTHLEPKSKQKLGKIGGKIKSISPEAPTVPAPKPKLGKIGGKGKLGKVGGTGAVYSQNESTAPRMQEDPLSPKQGTKGRIVAPTSRDPMMRGRMVQQPPEPSPPRETSQERADRKRAQLKRELENKSQAAIKKKRRF